MLLLFYKIIRSVCCSFPTKMNIAKYKIPYRQAEMEEEGAGADSSKFLLSHDDPEQAVDPEMQARLEALLQAAGKLLLFIY